MTRRGRANALVGIAAALLLGTAPPAAAAPPALPAAVLPALPAAVLPAVVEPDPAPVVLLPSGDLTVSGGSGQVVVANQTTREVSITLKGYVLPAGGQQAAVPLRLSVTGEGQAPAAEVRRRLEWGQTVAVTVETPASGAGVLTLEATSGRAQTTLEQRALTAAAGPEPVTTTWTGRAGGWRDGFSGASDPQIRIPTATGGCPPGWAGPEVVLADGPDAIRGSSTCVGDAVVVDLPATPRVGVYTGALSLGSQRVDLSLTSSAGWLWAAALAALGTLLAIAQRAWVINRRPFKLLRETVGRLPRRAREADRQLVAGPGGSSVPRLGDRPAYRLEPGVEQARKQLDGEIRRELRSLGWVKAILPRPQGEVSEDLGHVVDDVAECERAIEAWAAAAPRFQDLAGADQVHAASARSVAPHVHRTVVELLHPAAPRHLAPGQVRPLLEQLEALARLLGLLPALAALREGVIVREGVGYAGADRVRFERARQAVTEAETDFRTLTWDRLRDAKVDVLLEEARVLLAGLPLQAPGPVARGVPPAGAAAAAPEVLGSLTFGPPDRSWWPAGLVPRLSRRTVDVLLLFLVAAAATWTGVTTLYDGAWGTWVDAVSAFVWGYGTGVLAGPLLAALERVTQRRPGLPAEPV